MATDSQRQPADNQVLEFIEYITAVATRVKEPLSDEVIQLHRQFLGTQSEGESPPIHNPPAFYRISRILYHKADLTMGELSRSLSVPLSTATRMASWLVDNGYAQRLTDAHDRRIVRVALTDRGRQVHEVTERFLIQMAQQFLDCLTAEEQMIFLTLFRKVASNLKEP